MSRDCVTAADEQFCQCVVNNDGDTVQSPLGECFANMTIQS